MNIVCPFCSQVFDEYSAEAVDNAEDKTSDEHRAYIKGQRDAIEACVKKLEAIGDESVDSGQAYVQDIYYCAAQNLRALKEEVG
jgi:hypothetical protein